MKTLDGIMENAVKQITAEFFDIFSEKGGMSFPKMNVIDRGEKLVITAEIPGFTKELVKITMISDIMHIVGLRGSEEPKSPTYIIREIEEYYSFNRKFRLGRNMDTSNISAVVADGILKIIIPRSTKSHSDIKVEIL